MNTKSDAVVVEKLTEEPPLIALRDLEVRALREDEKEMAARLLEQEHYLGKGQAVGKTLSQVVHYHGRWVALLEWGPASLKLADRDEWVGWSDQQRAERINFVVQNRRFLVLAATRMPNLASRALALATNALALQWEERHGYRPLLAETFTDIEQFEGTCYKAAGWIPCGLTKGFKRHRADFYQKHGRPKKLWLKTLSRNSATILRAMDMPKSYQAGLSRQTPERALPLHKAQIDSLREAFRQVDDPRAVNRKFTFSSLMTLVAMGLLAGRKYLTEIQRFGQYLTPQQRAWLEWPLKKNGSGRQAPSYSALYNLLCQLDPESLISTLCGWLQSHHGTLPRALALDGKYIRDIVLTLCLSEHESGAPVAMTIAAQAPKTEESKREGELTAARRLYETTPLQGAIVTADALHCEKQTASLIVEHGGDYLLQLKANQPNALQRAQLTALKDSPLLPAKALT
jgi:Domain of unknown function (DUF4338)/DDE_Tnp_1-associated